MEQTPMINDAGSNHNGPGVSNLPDFVRRIQNWDSTAEQALFEFYRPGLAFLIARSGTPDVQRIAHEVLLDVLYAIREGRIHDTDCLTETVRIAVKRRIALDAQDRTGAPKTLTDPDRESRD